MNMCAERLQQLFSMNNELNPCIILPLELNSWCAYTLNLLYSKLQSLLRFFLTDEEKINDALTTTITICNMLTTKICNKSLRLRIAIC